MMQHQLWTPQARSSSGSDSDGSLGSDSDEEIFGAKKEYTEDDSEEEAQAQADMIRREEELKAELDMRTQRCAELKKTLKETISFASAMSGDNYDNSKQQQ